MSSSFEPKPIVVRVCQWLLAAILFVIVVLLLLRLPEAWMWARHFAAH